MREWNLKKEHLECKVIVNDDLSITTELGDVTINNCYLNNGILMFRRKVTININGIERVLDGVKLDQLREEIEEYYNRTAKENYDREFNAILNGEQKLKITYQEGEYLSGYSAYGIDADVIKKLYCGKDIEGWGFCVDDEFKDGNIEKMKSHSQTIIDKKNYKLQKEKEAKEEKEKDIEGVIWDTKETTEIDEGGKTLSYRHTIFIENEKYEFCERNIFDFGRVINPEYKISENSEEEGGLIKKRDNKYFWMDFEAKNGWNEVRELSVNELRAYKIVEKYGMYANAEIRM